jgi:hypothetical protein
MRFVAPAAGRLRYRNTLTMLAGETPALQNAVKPCIKRSNHNENARCS